MHKNTHTHRCIEQSKVCQKPPKLLGQCQTCNADTLTQVKIERLNEKEMLQVLPPHLTLFINGTVILAERTGSKQCVYCKCACLFESQGRCPYALTQTASMTSLSCSAIPYWLGLNTLCGPCSDIANKQ